ncbi:DUF4199 domain-containing protein [Kordiimonas aquimaris]|uniref:DUF4199 domain-containing protein n=1 Tax=Kordiimonas aquimaris TaxID=707591 RepID=UPI0021D1B62E|nr:DUF4199 domain-containing protein [Kordiimonas aquimaris]
MRKIILVYGTIAGLIIITTMLIGLIASNKEGIFSSEAFGYLTMLVSLSLIFFGIKRYRDNELGGVIQFTTALWMGLAIAGLASVMYVAVWEVYLAFTDHAFINEYVESTLAQYKAAGVSETALQQHVTDMEEMKVMYAKFYYRLPITFLEIFPVGMLIAFISAALLRNPRVLPD